MRRGVPRDHHRPAGHRLAGELVVPFVHYAVLVDLRALHAKVARVDDDAGPAGVPIEPQLEDRQAGLRRDRHAHLVGDVQAVRAGELLFREEQEHQVFQLGRFGNKRQTPRRALPQRLVDRVLFQHALAPPLGDPSHETVKYRMVTVVQLHPASGAAALGALAEGLAPADRDLIARALEFAEPLYAGELLSTGEPTWTHGLGLGASLAAIGLDAPGRAAGLLFAAPKRLGAIAKLREPFAAGLAAMAEG